jgi:hypothetical protein
MRYAWAAQHSDIGGMVQVKIVILSFSSVIRDTIITVARQFEVMVIRD